MATTSRPPGTRPASTYKGPGLHSPHSARRIRTIERQREAIALRTRGLSFSEIGAELGVSRQAAHKLVVGALEATKHDISQKTDDLRAVWAERLEALAQAILPRALDGDLAAHDRLIKLADRFARLTGLDLRAPDAEINVGTFVLTDGVTAEQIAAIPAGAKVIDARLPSRRDGSLQDIMDGDAMVERPALEAGQSEADRAA